MKIKKLEWIKSEYDGAISNSLCDFHKYSIIRELDPDEDMRRKYYAGIISEDEYVECDIGVYNTLDEAKEACQKDLERRIMMFIDME